MKISRSGAYLSCMVALAIALLAITHHFRTATTIPKSSSIAARMSSPQKPTPVDPPSSSHSGDSMHEEASDELASEKLSISLSEFPTKSPTASPSESPSGSFYPSNSPSNAPSGCPTGGSRAKMVSSMTSSLVGGLTTDMHSDKFNSLPDNTVKKAREQPVSTFSADVDTASYSYARRMLKDGLLPSPDSIKIEEFINYFDYNYPKPEHQETPFEASVAIDDSPWHEGRKLLHIGIKGYDVDPSNAPPANIVFLVDVSGSMHGKDRLDLAKESMKMLVKSLQPDDHVSIVTYASNVKTPLLPTRASKQKAITSAIDSLVAGGGTWGTGGLALAYDLAEINFDQQAVNRIVLMTDGDFNIGTTDEGSLEEYIQKKRETGIFLSVLGFGMGNYHDTTMKALANHGNGVAAYIDTLEEAHKVMVTEASSTIFPIAKDVKIQVEFNPATVSEYRLIGYEKRMLNREDFNNDKVDAGEIGSGHTVTAIYEITPVGSTEGMAMDDLRYSTTDGTSSEDNESQWSGEYAFLKIRSKLPDEDESKLVLSKPITVKDDLLHSVDEALLNEFRFATAVASFAQNLKNHGEENTTLSYEKILELANPSGVEPEGQADKFGYRKEFMNLVMIAKRIKDNQVQEII